ncbi:MAG: putative Ig domain-containing protein [Streptosporangiaceae bacterium]
MTRSGTLPAGVSFTNNGNRTATISGTPTAAAGGSYPVTLTAKDTAGTTTQSFC